MKERQEDGRFCRAYLRTMDPERAAAEINRRDGYTMLGRKTTQQHLEQMRSAAAATVKREDILRQLAKLAFGGAEDAVRLAETMVQIGEAVGRRTVALITNMDAPLGNAVGNTLEVREAVETLEGHGPSELTTICRELAANMLYLAGKGDIIHCNKLAREAILTGAALAKFKEMVAAQGGDVSVIEDTQKLPAASDFRRVKAPMDGYITHIDAEKCGLAAAMLGAGRQAKGDAIDYTAGIYFKMNLGEQVDGGFEFARLYTSGDPARFDEAERLFLEAVTISPEPLPESPKLILGRVSAEGTELY